MRVYISDYQSVKPAGRLRRTFWSIQRWWHQTFLGTKNSLVVRWWRRVFLKNQESSERNEQQVKVQVHPWDLTNVDRTLAYVISEVLTKYSELPIGGWPNTDPLDGPAHLMAAGEGSEERWNWIVDEMTWAFQQYNTSWHQQYQSGESDYVWEAIKGGGAQIITGPNHTLVIDEEGQRRHQERIDRGIYLFGKYYKYLWR